jgi:AcrR family transcriptional regulator
MMQTIRENKHVQKSNQTRAHLLATAREMFVARGYAHVSAEEIVQAAGMTRGALYHHFDGKDGLFAALYDQMQDEVSARIDASCVGIDDEMQAFRVCCFTWLEACVDPDFQQVVLRDAPNVLSWEAWLAADEDNSLHNIQESLGKLAQQGVIAPDGLDALAHMLIGGMNQVALYIARADDPHAALGDAKRWLERVLGGIMLTASD